MSGIYGNVGQTNYGAAKAGIAAFTVIAALELGRYGVTVNAIAPRRLTRMTEDLRHGYTDEDKETRSPRWIAPVVTWLASEGAARSPAASSRPATASSPSPRAGTRDRKAEPILDPREAGKILTELAKKARKNAGMNGLDLD